VVIKSVHGGTILKVGGQVTMTICAQSARAQNFWLRPLITGKRVGGFEGAVMNNSQIVTEKERSDRV
jgi:hypothetical protein